MTHPGAVRVAIAANVVVAAAMVALLVSGYLALEPDFALSWPVVVGLAAWIMGTAGLWWGRRWGWYLTTMAATLASLLATLIGVGLVFFHGVPTWRMLANNPEVFAMLGGSLVPWVTVVTLLHPEVRRFVGQPGPADDLRFLPRHVLRRLILLALVALMPAAWLAAQPALVHRSVVDGTEPGYTSNYLEARGLLFPWIVTEVPADLPIHWPRRVFPMNLLALYFVAAAPVVVLYLATAALQGVVRRTRGRPD